MMRASDRRMGDLLRMVDQAPVDAVPSVVREALAPAGVAHAVLYLIDYNGTYLRPAPGSPSTNGEPAKARDLEGAAGACFREQRLIDDAERGRVWVPVAERANALGVLEVVFDREPDDTARELCRDAGLLLGHCLVTARKYTDVYELLRRRRDMNLAAEMHWDLLPATCYSGPSVTVAAALEPAYEVGGDAFDYCLNAGILDFTIMDAMGHGLRAALLSVQAVTAYRFARRRQQSVEEICATVDRALRRQFGGRRFVTALFCKLDVETGKLRWVNAGHVSPLLVRDGRAEELDRTGPACPLGIDLLDETEDSEVSLRPGDRLLLYSDGVVEARDPRGASFELQRLVELVEKAPADVEAEELSQRLIHEVMRHSGGPLRDDATVLVVEQRPVGSR